jgi:hypothetical protein
MLLATSAGMSALHVRREKAAFSSGCKPARLTVPAGNNRSICMEATKWHGALGYPRQSDPCRNQMVRCWEANILARRFHQHLPTFKVDEEDPRTDNGGLSLG